MNESKVEIITDQPMDAKLASLEVYDGQMYFRYIDDSLQDEGILINVNGEQVTGETLKQMTKSVTDLNLIFKKTEDEKNSDIIDDISSFIKQYIFIEDKRLYTVLSLFTILSYSIRLFDRIPYLHIRGHKGSGKTTLVLVLKSMMYNPYLFTNMTAATMFRLIEQVRPTLFIDEVENLESSGSTNKPIFQILNSGYQKDGKVPRMQAGRIKEFSTFCMKIIAGIESIHPTTEDRCIGLNMKQINATSAKLITSFDDKNEVNQKLLLIKLLRALHQKQKELLTIISTPESLITSDSIYGREYDKWFPLMALAKVFSSEEINYLEIVNEFALESIEGKKIDEANTPENLCRTIIKDFITSPRAKSLIMDDKNYLYFRCAEIQHLINSQDPFNFYRNKGDITKVLKTVGITVDRRRIDKSGPTQLYKVPKTL